MAEACCVLSFLLLLVTIALAVAGLYRRVFGLKPLHLMMAGVFVSTTVLFLPAYGAQLEADRGLVLGVKTALLSIRNAMCLFVLNGEFDMIRDYTAALAPGWAESYSVLGAVLFVLAPILTVSFVIAFFLNAMAQNKLFFLKDRDFYVFSELNEHALILAESLKKKEPGSVVVFHSVSGGDSGKDEEQMDRVRAINACCLPTDVTVNHYDHHSEDAQLWFFAIREDEEKNVQEALQLQRRFWGRVNTRLYVFSSAEESELLFGYTPPAEQEKEPARSGRSAPFTVRRINPVKSLINHTLFEQGGRLFDHAIEDPDGKKEINAVILGLGRYGAEMLKALAWYCQMDGYTLRVNAFDWDEVAVERLKGQCPELLDDDHNGLGKAPGEAEYEIRFHSGMDVFSGAFEDTLKTLPPTTYVLVSLGSDAENLRGAVRMRMLCLRQGGGRPQIQAVVNSWQRKAMMADVKDFRGKPYDIELLGDDKSLYDQRVIVSSTLEKLALGRHLSWGAEEDFWAYEYNYASSVATAIHLVARTYCKLPGTEAGVTWEEGDPRLEALQKLEHRRWNAYMRSIGYRFSGDSRDKSSRSDMGKLHFDLAPFDQLLEAEKKKDSAVGLGLSDAERAALSALVGRMEQQTEG